MVVRDFVDGAPFSAALHDQTLTVSLGPRLVAACDRAGRLYSFWKDGHTWRRGLSGRLLHKWHDETGRHCAWPDEADGDAIVDEAASAFRRLHDTVKTRACRWSPEADPMQRVVMLAALELGARFTAGAARADAKRFAQVYSPIGILPPDQYLSLVVQGTTGCSFTSCTFCDLYHEPYRVKTALEFEQHLERVRAYLGASLTLRRRSIFLGAANALAAPLPRLIEWFNLLVRELEAKKRGVGAFVDGFTGARRTTGDFQTLAKRGLRHVYVGLESGHDPLLGFVRKPATRAAVVDTVRAAKAAGVRVGVIVMVGLGGDRYAAAHAADTIATLNAMRLGAGDILYFSDLVEIPGTTYTALAAGVGIRALTPAERGTQRQAIRDGLRFGGPPPKISTYSVREFVY
jgi:hypothetical protein